MRYNPRRMITLHRHPRSQRPAAHLHARPSSRASPRAAACSCPSGCRSSRVDGDRRAWRRCRTTSARRACTRPSASTSPPRASREIAAAAYGDNFDDPAVAPVREAAPGRFVLELWHGPTLAFKDMALQCMPLFFSEALEQAHASGAHRASTSSSWSRPRATPAWRRSTASPIAPTRASACTTRTPASAPCRSCRWSRSPATTSPCSAWTATSTPARAPSRRSSTTAPSPPSWPAGTAWRSPRPTPSTGAGCMPQIAYYVSAYADMVARGAVAAGDPLDVCVPTGNFGNILAAYYAKRMGVPLGRLLCASNANKVLADFIATGVYDISHRGLVKTPSPSHGHPRLVQPRAPALRPLRRRRPHPPLDEGPQGDRPLLRRRRHADERCTAEFTGAWVDNDTCLQTIGGVQREHGYLLDPHTAVAWKVAEELGGADAPVLIVSTAHWSKFAADVVRGLRGVPAGAPIPGAGPDIGLLDRRHRAGAGRHGAAAAAGRARAPGALRRARRARPRGRGGQPARLAGRLSALAALSSGRGSARPSPRRTRLPRRRARSCVRA